MTVDSLTAIVPLDKWPVIHREVTMSCQGHCHSPWMSHSMVNTSACPTFVLGSAGCLWAVLHGGGVATVCDVGFRVLAQGQRGE